LLAADAAARTALVSTLTSTNANGASMKLVVPGDPASSFLMVKCEYDKATIETCATECGALGCGLQMPSGSPPLTDSELDILRRWIKDGAKDN
jgi:hypothetical protein